MNDTFEKQEKARLKQEKKLEASVDYFLDNESISRKRAPESIWANIFWLGWTLARYWDAIKAPFSLFINGWFQYRQEWGMKTPIKTYKKYGDQNE